MFVRSKQIIGFLLISAIGSSFLLAQSTYTISGLVLEEDSNEPLVATQVFLIGTTIGTTTDSNGEFKLSNIPEGIFELSVSFLGYESSSITINTNNLRDTYIFTLKPKVYELDEVTVRPDLKTWKQNFEQFREYFIGTGPFSDKTKIKNPEVLSFDFNPYERYLSASAHDMLIIENKDLGYTINYYLDYFVINYKEGSSFYYGRPFFIPMESKRKRIVSRWKKNRNTAYHGSFLHFSKALINNSAEQEGFLIRGEKRENKARYLGDSTISADIFFQPVDSTTFMFNFINFVNVTYRHEKEHESYLEYIWSPLSRNPRTVTTLQNSSFTTLEDSVLIDKSGYIYKHISILKDGYWAFERVSDMLPLNFIPSEK